jgi:AcrR family transcriptional regulator
LAETARRRRKLSSAERRERLIEAAMRVFARRGFRGATSARIARAAGVSEALVFKHFGSKEGLYRAIIERKIEGLGEGIFPREAAARGDDEAVLRTMAGNLLGNMEQDPSLLRLLLFSALEGEALSAIFTEVRVTKVIRFLADHLRRRMEAGALRAEDPELAAVLFLGQIAHFALCRQVFGLEAVAAIRRDAVVDQAVATALDGLRAPERRR